MNKCCFFSILIPCFNSEKYIGVTIDSILSQGGQDFEVIVIDDHSTDDTYDVVKKLSDCESRIKLLRNKFNKGVSGARNFGASLAKGEWLCFLDSDDCYTQAALQNRKRAIEAYPDCNLFCGDFYLWSGDKNNKGPKQTELNAYWKSKYVDNDHHDFVLLTDTARDFIKAPLTHTGTTTIRKALFDKLGGFNTALKRCEDDHLWIRAAAASQQIVLIREADLLYRQHPHGLSAGGGSLTPWHPVMLRMLLRDPLLTEHRAQLRQKLSQECYFLSLHYRAKQDWRFAIRYALQSLTNAPFTMNKWRNLGAALVHRS